MKAEATSPQGAAVSYSVSATDLVDGAVKPVCDREPGSTFPLGVTHVSCRATDRHGNAAESGFAVSVVDTTGPVLKLPGDLTAEATSAKGAIVQYPVSATDAVSGAATVTCTRQGLFPLGRTAVACSATDARGNRSQGSFVVNVVDTTPPALRLPGSFSVNARWISTAYFATITYSASAVDRVDGAVAVSCSIPSGTQVSVQDTTTRTITCSATDSHGNRASGSFDVTIVVPPPIVLR